MPAPQLVIGTADPAAIRASKRKLNGLAATIYSIASLGKAADQDPSQVELFRVRHKVALGEHEHFKVEWWSLDELYVQSDDDASFPSQADQVFKTTVENQVTSVEIYLNRILDREKAAAVKANVTQASADITMSHSRSHLPRVPIPNFDGDLMKWHNFRDTYLSLIHEDPNVSNIEKFNYLRNALRGEALTLITPLPVTGDNYPLAWELITKTYNNPRVLASHYVRRVLDFKLTSKPSLESYKSYLAHVVDNVDAFKKLAVGNPTDFLLSMLALRSLDSESRREFELKHLSTEFPTTENIFAFIRDRIKAYRLCAEDTKLSHESHPQSTAPIKPKETRFDYAPQRSDKRYSSLHVVKKSSPSLDSGNRHSRSSSDFFSKHPCFMCKGPHYLGRCPKFLEADVERRYQLIGAWRGCYNCLYDGHVAKSCNSRHTCTACHRKHHSLLHKDDSVSTSPKSTGTVVAVPSSSKAVLHSTSGEVLDGSQVILGTARIFIGSQDGTVLSARALFDPGSERSVITSDLARKLSCELRPCSDVLSGLTGITLPPPLGIVTCSIHGPDRSYPFRAIVCHNVSSDVPSSAVPSSVVQELTSHDLADGDFGVPSKVDVLFGANVVYHLITGIPSRTPYPGLFLLPTIFGPIVVGEIGESPIDSHGAHALLGRRALDVDLERFWRLEEPAVVARVKPDDEFCEKHFLQTHFRNEEGRFVVNLPISSATPPCGNNRAVAEKRFQNLEHKLSSEPALKREYIRFMEEYISLGHMSPAAAPAEYLIPHHGIWKGEIPHRKLRVVFDASCPSKTFHNGNAVSLNDNLLSGPKLQTDISDILTGFRLYQVALTCDLVKMYRQVLVHPSQRMLQHILWRSDPSSPLIEYELNTLTYGEKPCAFLAIRAIRQLAEDERDKFPIASRHVCGSMYVDDLVSGTNSEEDAAELRTQLIGLFESAGFQLDKWSSNVPNLVPSTQHSNAPLIFEEEEDFSAKILGLKWDPKEDTFSYTVTIPATHPTKRSILSSIARVFDPLGFLAPAIFSAKILMQDLWKQRVDWDDRLPSPLASRWEDLTKSWSALGLITIPRVITWPAAKMTLVGFCDASQSGYAAAVYMRSQSGDKITSFLIKAKSKVAPVKHTSIARLELCGALLLCRLLLSIHIPFCRIQDSFCFTDSQIVLSWMQTPTYELKTFEANRVTAILDVVPLSSWHYVKSDDNPADIASRGCLPHQLSSKGLWWAGPSWLLLPVPQWDAGAPSSAPVDTPALRVLHLSNSRSLDWGYLSDWMSTFSTLGKLVRSVVQVLRFGGSRPIYTGPVTADEYARGLLKCVLVCQRSSLPSDTFSRGKLGQYKELNPFFDEDGVLRVGGRLRFAPIPYHQRHPYIIPKDSHLARLIVDDVHIRHFHAGPSLTLSLVRNSFWIPGGLRLVKGQIGRCVFCRKRSPRAVQPLMGDLPRERFGQFRAFVHSGVDYAGPFLIRPFNRRRSPRTTGYDKAYLCIFVCLASRAVHLECVSSLTTVAFLAALDRFVSRRGVPTTISSDHGTNFVGAANFLSDLYRFLNDTKGSIIEHLSPQGITWKFIPPRAPTFGGGWEAGVKSVKRLLTHSVGSQPFTFEELSTIFTQIEGLLNSRPLCPLSDDPESFDTLTPGHFLIGAPLGSLPDSDSSAGADLRCRWNVVTQQVRHVWSRWKTEYLHHLQQRVKWNRSSPNLKVGDLVILLHKSLSNDKWPVGRVISTLPGEDSIVRVVSVKLPSGKIYERAVSTLAPLFPVSSDPAEDSSV